MSEKNGYRSTPLDGLRGIAAVSVIFYHAMLMHERYVQEVLIPPVQSLSSWSDILAKIALSLVNGHSAVILFFVLSGYVLTGALQRARGSAISRPLVFVVRRIFRLYPALIVCLAGYYLLAVTCANFGWFAFHVPDPGMVLKNMLLTETVWHGPSQTIQAEIVAIPFLLIAYAVISRFGAVGSIICFVFSLFAIEQPDLVLRAPGMNAWLPAFFLGAVISDKRLEPYFAAAARQKGALIGIVLGYLFLRAFSDMNAISALIAQIFLCASLVGCVLYADPQHWVVRVLNSPVSQFLGRISYSLYLINVPLLLLAWFIVSPRGWYDTVPLLTGLLVGTTVTLATLPLAYLSAKFVEEGGIRLGTLVTRGRRPSLADPSVHAAP